MASQILVWVCPSPCCHGEFPSFPIPLIVWAYPYSHDECSLVWVCPYSHNECSLVWVCPYSHDECPLVWVCPYSHNECPLVWVCPYSHDEWLPQILVQVCPDECPLLVWTHP